MTQIFNQCKEVPASEIAQREGIVLHQRGLRSWSCCPLHGEDTASLMFDEGGRWHCFGCNSGGDAVDFYSALHKTTSYEAAQAISKNYSLVYSNIPLPISPARKLRDKVEEWYRLEWNRACDIKHKAATLISAIDQKYNDSIQNDNGLLIPASFYQWVAANAAAECRLEELALSVLQDKIAMMLEEQHEHSQTC